MENFASHVILMEKIEKEVVNRHNKTFKLVSTYALVSFTSLSHNIA